MNKNEVLFRKSFNISQNFEKLIDGFKFSTDPRDGIKDVKIKDVTVVSPCESYDFSFAVNDNKKAILDAIKAKNISTRCLAVKEIGLDVTFYEGFLDKKKNMIPVKIKYFSNIKTTIKHPVINKYLESWGLLEARSV
jgi:Tat protein secretion system quality control protein TatD with DNase activity